MLKNFLKASHTDWFVTFFSGKAAIYELSDSVKTNTNEFPELDLGFGLVPGLRTSAHP